MLLDGKGLPVKVLTEETLEMRHRGCGIVPNSKKHWKVRKSLVLLPFMDYETHDIPVYIIASSENGYELEKGFRRLKGMGYDLKILVCDESMAETAQVAEKIYPDIIVQTCLIHYSKAIDRDFKVNSAKRKIKAIQKKMDDIDNDVFIPTRHYSIKRAMELTNEMADLEYEYGYLIDFQKALNNIFWGVKTEKELGEAEDRMNEVISCMDLDSYPYKGVIKKRYDDYYKKRDKITAFTKYPNLYIPKTTNLIEGFNSTTIEMRLGSIRGFETEETAINYANAMILRYRFHKFKCCKKRFKHLNQKSPLEIAKPLNTLKFDFKNSSKNWIEFCKKLKPKKQDNDIH